MKSPIKKSFSKPFTDIINFVIIKSCFLILIFCFQTERVSAYYPLHQYIFGLDFNYAHQNHVADFKGFSSTSTCCIDDMKGDGKSISISTFFSFPIFIDHYRGQIWDLGFNLGFSKINDNLFGFGKEAIIVNDTLFNGEFKHSIDINYSAFFAGIFFNWNMEGGNLVYGFECNFINQSNYIQKEEISFPKDGVVFQNTNTHFRNIQSGDIPNLQKILYLAYMKMVQDFQLNSVGTYVISPYLFCDYQINEISKSSGWHSVSFGLGFCFKFFQGSYKPYHDPNQPFEVRNEQNKNPLIIKPL
jgi:hypothetical protein